MIDLDKLENLSGGKKGLIALGGIIVVGWLVTFTVYGFGGAMKLGLDWIFGWIGGGSIIFALIIGYLWLVFTKLYK